MICPSFQKVDLKLEFLDKPIIFQELLSKVEIHIRKLEKGNRFNTRKVFMIITMYFRFQIFQSISINKLHLPKSVYIRVSPKYTFFIILTNIQNVAVCIPYKITGKRIGILNGLGHECTKVLIIQRKSQNIQRKICDQIVLALISHRMVQSM